MLLKRIFIMFLLVFSFLTMEKTIANDADNVGFNSGEHILLGNTVTLFFPIKDGDNYVYRSITGDKADFREWINPNLKASLSYGKIVATPDLFADGKNAISDGISFSDRCVRFEKAFSVFTNAKTETLNAVFNLMDKEVAMINDALQKGIQPSEAYAKMQKYFDTEYFLADPATADLLLVGWDHFGKYAWLSYEAGHAEAIATAVWAHNITDPIQQRKTLVMAYAKEAYAGHFLSDRFAAGHMRTPDKEIADILPKNDASQGVAALIALIMHNEDNKNGVNVDNKNGNNWIAYGDARYMDDVNKQNRDVIETVMKKSVDEITLAFQSGNTIPIDKYAALNYIVNLDKLDDYQTYVDSNKKTIPMFVYDANSQDVLRRIDLNIMHPKTLPVTEKDMLHHGKNGWDGMETLLLLLTDYHPELIPGLITKDGKLTLVGMHFLDTKLDVLQKGVLCADETSSEDLKTVLQCEKIFQR